MFTQASLGSLHLRSGALMLVELLRTSDALKDWCDLMSDL